MNPNDVIVGGIGCGLGLFFLAAAALNWNWSFELRKTRWLTARFGRPAARLVLAGVGLLLIALGVAISLGFRWQIF